MPKTKKKFIDKKNSVTFHVVHRSQHDPLVTDETAPQHVLVPQETHKTKGKKNKDEEAKYGIYFDDDYDYLQHLKESQSNDFILLPAPTNASKEKTVKPKVMLPSSVFESEVEEKVGMLNKAAPQSGLRLDLDPDIVAAMDDDFDFKNPENELEDDFVVMANQLGSNEELIELEDVIEECDDYDSEAYDEVGSLNMEETKSQFTNYSMSSSVIRRNENLKLIDDQFEQLFAAYDDAEIGALDTEEIEGTLTMESDILKKASEEFELNMKKEGISTDKSSVLIYDSDSNNEEPTYKVPVDEVDKKKWDCESILSTYSNIYNHPALIRDPVIQKIQINPRTGVPILQQRLTAKALKSLENSSTQNTGTKSIISALSMLSVRSKSETPEEKLKRKKALKEYRKERRQERKANTEAFKEQKKKLEKELINRNVNKTVRVM
ncbi:protein LTV1 homolog isoform X2 [Adelges cooleyi]|uniref:protein LTV1 homolog isoform X2 n=1 Tax=Adelges cooleyi TaxID=133065 RepID=UPI00217F2B27|nr:protein LTV1 homolog isoform X2 [Adelges cooleyi]